MDKKHLVLIVDDKEENRLLLRKIIESLDYTVQEASDGKEGLEKAKRYKPSLIISDVLMPVMDGFLFCRSVKNNDKLKNIPFIFYTATYTDKKDEVFGLSLGAEKYIIKPAEPVMLLNLIQPIIKKYENGEFAVPKKILKDEQEMFKLYSERLVNKLEKKTLNLEKEITKHKRTEIELVNQRDHLEELVKKRTKELEKQNINLQAINDTMVDREFRINDLNQEIKELKKKLI